MIVREKLWNSCDLRCLYMNPVQVANQVSLMDNHKVTPGPTHVSRAWCSDGPCAWNTTVRKALFGRATAHRQDKGDDHLARSLTSDIFLTASQSMLIKPSVHEAEQTRNFSFKGVNNILLFLSAAWIVTPVICKWMIPNWYGFLLGLSGFNTLAYYKVPGVFFLNYAYNNITTLLTPLCGLLGNYWRMSRLPWVLYKICYLVSDDWSLATSSHLSQISI